MAYQGQDGWTTVFPTAKRPPASSSGGSSRRSSGGGPKPCRPGQERNPVTGRCVKKCQYGPRGADGYCPPKSSSSSGMMGALSPLTTTDLRKRRAAMTALERLAKGGTAAAIAAGGAGARSIAAGLAARSAASATVAAGLTASLLAGAGLAAYYVTKKILAARAAGREDRAEAASELAAGYRKARVDAEAALKRPLTPAELMQFSKLFKAKLKELGLTTDDLGGL